MDLNKVGSRLNNSELNKMMCGCECMCGMCGVCVCVCVCGMCDMCGVCGCVGVVCDGAHSHVEHGLFRSCHFQSSLVTGDRLCYLSCRYVCGRRGVYV